MPAFSSHQYQARLMRLLGWGDGVARCRKRHRRGIKRARVVIREEFQLSSNKSVLGRGGGARVYSPKKLLIKPLFVFFFILGNNFQCELPAAVKQKVLLKAKTIMSNYARGMEVF